MIRLKNILTEISLNSIAPYATQFTWRDEGDGIHEAEITAEGNRIIFAFVLMTRHHGAEYSFAMLSQDRGREGFTVSHARSAAAGSVNYLRLMRTAGEAVLDFLAIHAPVSVDVTGADTASTEKDAQKTRIYRALLSANAARIATAGYTVLDRGTHLYLVRKSTADSTGVSAT